MQATDPNSGDAQLSVGWQDGSADLPQQGDASLERAAQYALSLTRTLAAGGYQPRRIDVGLRRREGGVLEMRVRGDVPHLSGPEFGRLARTTLHAINIVDDTDDVVLWAMLDADVGLAGMPTSPAAAKLRGQLSTLPRASGVPIGRLAIALMVGLLLGVVGLPRLELPFLATSAEQPLGVVVVQEAPTSSVPEPTPALAPPTSAPLRSTPFSVPPTSVPARVVPTIPSPPTATPERSRVLFAERFVSPLPTWPNNRDGMAWFDAGGFHLFARQPGRFVAVGVPLQQPVGDALLSAQFHKVSGPPGGGYGLIIRDQGAVGERDSRTQTGQFLVLEVGDSGNVGIWQRDDTHWIDVLPWTHSDTVHTDRGTNAMAITMRGSELRFEVNGQVVGDLIYDGVPPQGGVGVFVGGDLNEVALEWLRIEIS